MSADEYTCDFCSQLGLIRQRYIVSTGVSNYLACYGCYRKWCDSDHTLEALRELQADGKKVTS